MRAVVLQHLEDEGPGLFGKFLDDHRIGYDCIKLHAGESIPTPDEHDIMLVMGASQPSAIGQPSKSKNAPPRRRSCILSQPIPASKFVGLFDNAERT